MTSLTPLRLGRSNIVKEYGLHDGAQSARPGLTVDCLPGDGAECFPRHSETDPLHLEQPLILLHQRVLGLGQNELERALVEILKRRNDRKPADEFKDQAVFEQVLRLDLAEDLALLSILGRDDLGFETDRAGRRRRSRHGRRRPWRAPWPNWRHPPRLEWLVSSRRGGCRRYWPPPVASARSSPARRP